MLNIYLLHSLPLDYRFYKARSKVMFLLEPQYLA